MLFLFSGLALVVFLVFVFFEHLLIMNFSLILASIFFSVLLYNQLTTSWLAYLLIMVFLSGLMVLFVYMTSLSSNDPVLYSLSSSVVLPVGLVFLWGAEHYMESGLNSLVNYNSSFSVDLVYKTYGTSSGEMTLVLIVYLFVALLVTVKISSISSTPLKMVS